MKKLTLRTSLLLGLLWVGLSGCKSGLLMDVELAMAEAAAGRSDNGSKTFLQSSFPHYPDISSDNALVFDDLLNNKKIFAQTISNTSEKKIITSQTVINVTDESAWNDYFDSNYDNVENYMHQHGPDFYKGVFRKGRTITLKPYALGQFEVTRELYEAVLKLEDSSEVNKNPSYFSGYGDSSTASGETASLRPVECVSWYDAVYFCNALTKCTMPEANCVYEISSIVRDERTRSIVSAVVRANYSRYGYRLPTEEEWEFAARGGDADGTDWRYAFSGIDTNGTYEVYSNYYKAKINVRYRIYDGINNWLINDENLRKVAWYNDYNLQYNHEGYAEHETGKKLPNAIGLYDMSGNVREWCADGYTESVFDKTENNPSKPVAFDSAVIRGGAWNDPAYDCSVSSRNYHALSTTSNATGIRICRTLP